MDEKSIYLILLFVHVQPAQEEKEQIWRLDKSSCSIKIGSFEFSQHYQKKR